MEPWRVVELVLVSVLVGAMLPVAFQASAALRAARRRIEKSGDALDRVLGEASSAVARLNRVTEPLDDGKRVRELLDAIDGLAKTVDQLRERAQLASAIGSAVAPAVMAAIRAIRAPAADGVPAAAAEEGSPSAFTGRKEVAS